jgi:hypothetical protein
LKFQYLTYCSFKYLCIAIEAGHIDLALAGDAYRGHQAMISRKTIALSFAAVLASASAAMAASNHHARGADRHRADRAAEARASYAAEPRWQDSYAAAPGWQNESGLHYYEADDNGSVWANYPGYVPITRN